MLYFDGSSSAKGPTGWLDTQEVLQNRRGAPVLSPLGWRDECYRIDALCAWGKDKGVDGFVRMDTAFEVMWCNFEDGLDLISRINMTAPDSTTGDPYPVQIGCSPSQHRPDGISMATLNDPIPENHVQPPWPNWLSPFMDSAGYEWIRITTLRYHSPQPGVRPIMAGLVSFYDAGDFPSLAAARRAGKQTNMAQTRVWANISDADADHAVDRIEDILARPDLWTHEGQDWQALARRVVDTWGGRLRQMNVTLIPARSAVDESAEFNTSHAIRSMRLLSYTLLAPYLDTGALPFSNTSRPELWLPSTLHRCSSQIIASSPPLSALSPEESLLRASIETVQRKLCDFAGRVLAQSMGAHPEDSLDVLRHWAFDLAQLMDWLDWATWWQCETPCGPHVSTIFLRLPSLC